MTLVKEERRQEQRIPMSYEEFLASFDEDVHAEWVDGEALVFMPPLTRHQRIVRFLVLLLGNFVEFQKLGEIFDAPFEMKVAPDSNSREPDILFVAKENLWRITEKKLEGPADLLIEVVSTESVKRDRDDKFYEYQDAGVREYWIIDPRPGRQRADFFVLDPQGRYRPVPLNEDNIYHSPVIPNFWFDVNWLWQEELPDPLRTLAKIIGLDALIAALREEQENG
jgi:Uma2 family endonuclease